LVHGFHSLRFFYVFLRFHIGGKGRFDKVRGLSAFSMIAASCALLLFK
jgi:hypothetical protein